MYSKTMNGLPSWSPRSMTATMLWCESPATSFASRLKRSTTSWCDVSRSWRILSATVRSSTRSWARKTLDMPPEPTSCSSSYRSATTSPAINVVSGPPSRARLRAPLPRRRAPPRAPRRDHERHEYADAVAVDAAGDEQQAALERLLGHAVRELLRRLLRRRVGDELDREHRAEAAHVADRGPALLPARASARGSSRRSPPSARRGPRRRSRRARRARRPARPGCRRRCRRRRRATGASMISARPSTPESGRPFAIDLATQIRSGSTPDVLDRRRTGRCGRSPSAPRRRRGRSRACRRAGAGPATNSGGATMNPPSPWTGSRTIAATVSAATDGRERALERRERVLGRDAAVGVRERHAVDLGRERPEARLVGVHLRGEREREQRAAVEGAVEGDHRRAARVGARELDGVLDRLGAGVEERGLDRARDRHALAPGARRARRTTRTGRS